MVKGKGFPVHTMKTDTGSRGIATLIVNLGTRQGESLASDPDRFTPSTHLI